MHQTASSINKFSVICGITSFAICLISRILYDTPFGMLHVVKGVSLLPPVWLFNIISYIWFFLIGFAAGSLIDKTSRGMNSGNIQISAYRGGIFYIISFFLSIIRYHVFFIDQMLFLSLTLSAICMICALICAVNWRGVIPALSCFIMYCFTIWQFYLFFVSLSVFLNN